MKRFFTPYIYILFLFWNISLAFSQNLTLKISIKDSANYSLVKKIQFHKKHKTKTNLLTEIDSLVLRFEKIGFLNNKVSTILQKDSIYTAHFILGTSTKKIKVYYDSNSIRKEILQQVSKTVNDDYFEVPVSKLQNSLQSITSFFEAQGDSFAKINLENINIKNTTIEATLNIKTSATRHIDKVIIKGVDDFPQSFVKHYFEINQKTIFNRNKLNKISKQINSLSFVSEAKPPEVLFTNDSTYVYLYLKKKKSNQFDGLIGFTSNEEKSNLTFNGYLDLKLNNIFNGGEKITLQWKNNGDNRQLFDVNLKLPYIFNSSFTPQANLNIYKQDSTFINTKIAIRLGYTIDYRNTLGVSYVSKSSTNLLDNFLSTIDDYSSNLYGLYYNYNILNNSFLYPLKFNLDIDVHTGKRQAVDLNTSQSQFNLDTYYILNVNRKNNIYIESTNGFLVSNNYLANELFRIGGVNSIRGFNEESIFASLYNVLKVEYRYNTNNTTYIYSISDFGYVENRLENLNQKIYSLGLGYAFNTNFGLLNLSYAIGKSDEQPFNFNNSRFHLKIISFF